jgi:hypothetical protein
MDNRSLAHQPIDRNKHCKINIEKVPQSTSLMSIPTYAKAATTPRGQHKKHGLKVPVARVLKTDNDIVIINKSFGFDTVVQEAQRAIDSAHVEA